MAPHAPRPGHTHSRARLVTSGRSKTPRSVCWFPIRIHMRCHLLAMMRWFAVSLAISAVVASVPSTRGMARWHEPPPRPPRSSSSRGRIPNGMQGWSLIVVKRYRCLGRTASRGGRLLRRPRGHCSSVEVGPPRPGIATIIPPCRNLRPGFVSSGRANPSPPILHQQSFAWSVPAIPHACSSRGTILRR